MNSSGFILAFIAILAMKTTCFRYVFGDWSFFTALMMLMIRTWSEFLDIPSFFKRSFMKLSMITGGWGSDGKMSFDGNNSPIGSSFRKSLTESALVNIAIFDGQFAGKSPSSMNDDGASTGCWEF